MQAFARDEVGRFDDEAWRRFRGLSLRLCALLWVLAWPALAHAEEQCPRWFPDFRCDREGRWEGWVSPVTMPYYFEDPFITTEVQAYGIWHEFPGRSVFQGGDAYVAALQARLAITDRLRQLPRDERTVRRLDALVAQGRGRLQRLPCSAGVLREVRHQGAQRFTAFLCLHHRPF